MVDVIYGILRYMHIEYYIVMFMIIVWSRYSLLTHKKVTDKYNEKWILRLRGGDIYIL